jgi:hypothetical protein
MKAKNEESGMTSRLLAHHRLIDTSLRSLAAAVKRGEYREIRELFQRFENNLLAHMNWEEMYFLPPYEKKFPREAKEIAREHAEIRTLLGRLGIEIDLHVIRDEGFSEFASLLESHARKEEHFYAFGDEAFTDNERESLARHFRRLVA